MIYSDVVVSTVTLTCMDLFSSYKGTKSKNNNNNKSRKNANAVTSSTTYSVKIEYHCNPALPFPSVLAPTCIHIIHYCYIMLPLITPEFFYLSNNNTTKRHQRGIVNRNYSFIFLCLYNASLSPVLEPWKKNLSQIWLTHAQSKVRSKYYSRRIFPPQSLIHNREFYIRTFIPKSLTTSQTTFF